MSCSARVALARCGFLPRSSRPTLLDAFWTAWACPLVPHPLPAPQLNSPSLEKRLSIRAEKCAMGEVCLKTPTAHSRIGQLLLEFTALALESCSPCLEFMCAPALASPPHGEVDRIPILSPDTLSLYFLHSLEGFCPDLLRDEERGL